MPRSARRLPRFIRAKRSHRPPLALQPRDLELLQAAHDFRLITTPQYLQLFREESRDGIYRRLQRLFHHGYLARLGSNPNAPMLYALDRRGADVLEVPLRKEAADRYVAHQLMIGDFRVALTLAVRARGVELWWRVTSPDLPVRPDGFFTLRFPSLPEGANRAHFFLEADRSTMPRERFVAKLIAYQRWDAAGGSADALGIRRFRVLTLTRSEERTRSLLTAARSAANLGNFRSVLWFAAERRYGAELGRAVLDAIWERADRAGELVGLMP